MKVCPLLCVCLTLRLTNTVFSAVLIYRRVDQSSGKKKVEPVPSVKEEATARNEKQSETEKEEREREGEGEGGCSSCYRHFFVPSKISDRLEQARILHSPRTADPLLRKSSGKGSFLAGSTRATRIRNPEE